MEFINRILNLVYPARCPFCQKIADGICPECKPVMRIIRDPYCFSCGKQLSLETEEYCSDCCTGRHRYRRGRALLQYEGREKEAIHKIKYENKREYLRSLAETMAEVLGNEIQLWDIDVCVPIPMYPAKKRRRGFNQSELLAKELGKQLGIAVDTSILKKTVDTGEQKKLSVKERRENLKDAFEAENCEGLRILLVDDVYTTGSTMDAAAEILEEAGAEVVYFVCICIGTGNN